MRLSSPHLPVQPTVPQVMRRVLLGLIPGIGVMTLFFGVGVLVNIAIAVLTALLAESIMLKLRGRELGRFLTDWTAVVTAALLAIGLPPLAPWWLPAIGAFFALVFGKHLYGGLGYNPFNPAMIGYVVLLIAFPTQMTLWPTPLGVGEGAPSVQAVLTAAFGGSLDSFGGIDALTGATPLDHVKTQLGLAMTVSEAQQGRMFGLFAGQGWEWLSLAFLAGGLYLLFTKTIRWQIPAGVLGGLALISGLFWLGDADRFASPLFHLTSGSAIVGAFFIATDPVTASTTPRGRLLFGAGIGILTWIIRTWGGYPDAIAFAVLLMNMAAPTIDELTQPRVYGHKSGRKRRED